MVNLLQYFNIKFGSYLLHAFIVSASRHFFQCEFLRIEKSVLYERRVMPRTYDKAANLEIRELLDDNLVQ